MTSWFKKLVSNSLDESNAVVVVRGFVEDPNEDFGTPGNIDGGWEDEILLQPFSIRK